MAIHKAQDQVGQWTIKVRFPRKRVTLRVTEEEFTTSRNSGNLMLVRKLEIVLPETINVDGAEYNIAGQEVTQYVVLRNLDPVTKERDEEKSSRSIARFLEERRLLGLPADEVDDENPPLDLTSMLIDAVVSCDESVSREEPTPEQRAKKELGTPIKDAQGNDLKVYRLKVEQLLGRSTAEVNKPY